MAFSPVAFIAPNYRDYKNYWLKFYEPGTTAPKAIALESDGGTQVAKLQLSADGFIVSAGEAIVMPYVDGYYDSFLFPTEAEADSNDTINAIRVADNLIGVNGIGDPIQINDLSGATGSTTANTGDYIRISDRGYGLFQYQEGQTPNTFNIIETASPLLSLVLINEAQESNVRHLGAKGDGVNDDSGAINAAIDLGLDVYLPDTDNNYRVTMSAPTLSRWQGIKGDSFTRVVLDTSVGGDFTWLTVSADNNVSNLYIEGVNASSGVGLLVSNGNTESDFAATSNVDRCWFRLLKEGVSFDNAFTISFTECQFRQCSTGTMMKPEPVDNPTSGGYLANITFNECRWNGNTVNDLNITVPDNARCRGVNFYGCTLDPMAGTPTESVLLINAALVNFDGCYLEAGTSGTSGPQQINATSSVFLNVSNCVMTGTGGIELTQSQMALKNVWSFSPVSPANDHDPIIADSTSFITIQSCTFRSTANDFIDAGRSTLIDATVRLDGVVTYVANRQYKNSIASSDEGEFIPEYAPETGSFANITYDANNTKGTYKKDGNKVFITGVIRTTDLDITGASGSVMIKLNVPYPSITAAFRSVITFGEVGKFGAFASNNPHNGVLRSNDDSLTMYTRSASNGPDIELQVTDLTTGASASNFIMFSGEYATDEP